MYQLYAYPNTYSIGVHLLLEESEVPYSIINPKAKPSLTDNAFYQASPHGRVPALIFPNGTTMCESTAIALHLADSLNDQAFSMPPDSVDRGRFLQWMFYLSSTLQPDVLLVFHPEHYFEDAADQTALVNAAQTRMAHTLAILEKEYAAHANKTVWMFDTRPTAFDFSLATVLLWPECFTPSSKTHPALGKMLSELSERQSFKRIMPWHLGVTDQPPQRLLS